MADIGLNQASSLLLITIAMTGCGGTPSKTQGPAAEAACNVTNASGSTGYPYGGGTGSIADPYLICSAAQFGMMPSNFMTLNNYKLTTDIDMLGTSFTGPANITNFDGNNHTVSNLTILSSNTTDIGFIKNLVGIFKNTTFTNLSINSSGTNVGLVSSMLTAGQLLNISVSGTVVGGGQVACLVGNSFNGKITNSTANCNVTGTGNAVGILVGYSSGSTISGSVSSGTVTGQDNVGGLVGSSAQDTISSSASSAVVTGHEAIGGFGGYIFSSSTFSQCHASGSTTGTNAVGGLVGHNSGIISTSFSTGDVSASGTEAGGFVGVNLGSISNAYSYGNVSNLGTYSGGFAGGNFSGSILNSLSIGSASGTSFVGGFCGANTGTITHSYWDTQASGLASSSAGTGLTTANLKSGNGAYVLWDFSDTWSLPSGGYPLLR